VKKIILILLLPLLAFAASCQYRTNKILPANLRVITQLPSVLVESSGIIVAGENSIWSLEDAGNTNKIYNFDTTGALLRTVKINNVENIDWEDMAIDEQGNYYIEDAGNNDNNRTDIAIYKIPNPETFSGNTIDAEIISFSLEDQHFFPPGNGNMNFDIEAMAWKSDSLFLFTKNRSNPSNGFSKMYKLPAQAGVYTAKLCDSLYIGNSGSDSRVTSADINPLSGELILLTPKKIISFKNYPANSFFEGQMTSYSFNTQPGQVESIAFVSPYQIYITEEGNGSTPGNLYDIHLPDGTIGVDETKTASNVFNIYPNPVISTLHIEPLIEKNYSYELFNQAGRKVMQGNSASISTLSFDALKKGIYLLTLNNGETRTEEKILKL